MMKHEQIESAIERLRKIPCGASRYSALEVVEAVVPDGSWVDGLIDLLQQADPDTHMELPVDADGEVIHIGDEMDCGEHFGVKGVEGFIHGAVAFTVCDPQSVRICACNARMTHHYHKPTVDDVLREFADEVYADADNEVHDRDFLCAKYDKKLREVMADDDR